MPNPTDELICACLTRVYADHATRTDRLTCKLEHALPIRHSFFRLKRVPHFHTRDDLHNEHTPAYIPIYRLENASLESLSQKTKSGCRRVLIEGDLGTGKTLVCQRLLHEWAKAMQFFRHVKINQPHITVGCEQDGGTSSQSGLITKPQASTDGGSEHRTATGNALAETSLSENDDIGQEDAKRKRRSWNLAACGVDNTSTEGISIDSADVRIQIPACPDMKPGNIATVSPKDAIEIAVITDGNAAEEGHRSRRALFVEQKEDQRKSPHRNDSSSSKSKMNLRKESRSRSSEDSEKLNANKKRNKAFDGIPQKYLSLLNIGSSGDGDIESPNRCKSFRESRRQRPSRLTSNLTDYKAMIYIPCVRMALSDLLTKCNNVRVRLYYVAAMVLLDLLTLSDLPHDPIAFDVVYQWVLKNREDICVIFDNLDGSEAWERLISDAFHEKDGFGKIIVASTPGRISKRNVDTLFYCYGLSTEYSYKIVLSRLRTEAPQVIDRISFLLASNHTQELLCNPLSLSLLVAYLRSVKEDDKIPEHLSELLENLIHHAMAPEVNTVHNISKGRRQRFSLQSVCETVAFECLENDTNYFSKQKFPQQFWTRHLCDCRVLHEVHEIANFAFIHERPASPTVSIAITPDSDSVHSSTSSNFEITLSSELCSSNQSLSSVDQDGGRSDADLAMGKAAGILLQVPSVHSSSDSSKKNAERPRSLTLLDVKKQATAKSVQTMQTSGEIVSFTSRCIRDFLASKRVCRYLQSDRDCDSFIERLIAKPQFYPVLRLTVRNLYISGRPDLILNLLDMLLAYQEFGFQTHFNVSPSQSPRGPSPTNFGDTPLRVKIPHRYRISNSDCLFRAKREEQKQRRSSTSILGTCFESTSTLRTSPSFNRLLKNTSSLSPFSTQEATEPTRGYLEDFKEALIWLAETDNSEPYIGAVSNRFPDILVISYHKCPPETIDHFICLTKGSVPPIKEVVLYMSGLYAHWDLGISLAEALNTLSNLRVLRISMKSVVETSFLVDFLCECFEKNSHIDTLYLEGPMNVAENLTPSEHKRVHKVFSERMLALKTLALDNFSYHHRIGYILGCWPNYIQNLRIKKCNIDSVTEKINEKLSLCPDLTSLTLENCFVPVCSLLSIADHILERASILQLTTLELTILSSSRKFNKSDAKKAYFKPALTYQVCSRLADILKSSLTLKTLILSYNGLSGDIARLLLLATPDSLALATLDLTGNLIGNDIQDDVILVISKAVKLKSLLLGDNSITKEARSAIIQKSLCRQDLHISL
ncbi:unnamed protein product [Candidula unifasciata]|uniref:Uncharacterized protein n=1 Tax=Candidula unifasciata TaxID=100452 RepID=A0A8S3Z3Z6_9EUPU|nr:unnamed protein product [Candidula unifasciata]